MKEIYKIFIVMKDNETLEEVEENIITFKKPIYKDKALKIARTYISNDFNHKKYHYLVDIEDNEGIYILENPNTDFEFIKQ